MYVFAIESSCDETSTAILKCEEGSIEVLSNIVSSQIDIHALYGGVVPEIASRAHCEAVTNVSREAVEKAGITLDMIDAVAVTFAPGLIGSLLVGLSFAKSLASVLGVPLIPVNHIDGHISAAYIADNSLKPPFLALVVSGGHTSIYKVDDFTEITEIGTTRDDACGEAFDKVGRCLGLPYPGGAAMDRLAAEAFTESKASVYKFPSPAVHDDTLDFSFSGLKTAVINTIHNEKQKNKSDDLDYDTKKRIAGDFTSAICSGVGKKIASAIEETGYTTLVMAGGVAANSHLRKHIGDICAHHKVKFVVPSLALCGDNAAMTGVAGYHMYTKGIFADSSLNAFASDEAAEEYFNTL